MPPSPCTRAAVSHPNLTLVIDHLGKPPVGGDDKARRQWRALLCEARLLEVVPKGIRHDRSPEQTGVVHARPDHAHAAFHGGR